MSLKKIKKELNKYGKEKEPFLFLLSYDFKKFYIEKLNSATNSIKYEISSKNIKKPTKKIKFSKEPLSFDNYLKKFELIQKEIKNGNTYLANLTTSTKIDTNFSFDEIYEFANSDFKLRVNTKDDDFVCFSPEKFIKIVDNKIYTYPMKGTISATIKDAKNLLLQNPKELAEHTMVVDLLRNDLGQVTKNVKVEKFRFIDEVFTQNGKLFQTSSKISAILDKNYLDNFGDIFLSLLPAGSITGTPKRKTIEILEKVEEYKRDFYTGAFGIFDGKNFESYVLIRFIEKIDNQLYYKSGGGITSDSIAKDEYSELINKIYLPF